jgi:hypothetical protein
MMIPEITIKISFTQPGSERSESTVTSVDVAPPALAALAADQIPPVPAADDGGGAMPDVPPPPAAAGYADADIPPLPSADEEANEREPAEPPPPGPKARRNRPD